MAIQQQPLRNRGAIVRRRGQVEGKRAATNEVLVDQGPVAEVGKGQGVVEA